MSEYNCPSCGLDVAAGFGASGNRCPKCLTPLKDSAESLRASNVALKAENEALKDNVCGSDCVRDRAQLAQYTSWQPSDPGTKEAMKTCRPQSDEEGEKRMSWVDTAMTLSSALTAAMVRLEEAEQAVIEEISLRLDADPHQWSKRPCATCSAISAKIGKDFGCVAYAKSPLAYADYGRNALAALAYLSATEGN